MKTHALLLLLPLALSACAFTGTVRSRAAFDLQCPEEKVDVQSISGVGMAYGARGCGRQASYVVRDGQVFLNSPVSDVAGNPKNATPEEQTIQGSEQGATISPN